MRRTTAAAAVAFSMVASVLTMTASPAVADTTMPVVPFDSIPASLPGNVASLGFEATSTSEFGDYATFDASGTDSTLQSVDVVMSSWGCQSGSGNTCTTTPGATFTHPITLTLYANNGGALGAPIATATQDFAIPYRPSADSTNCPDAPSKWYSVPDDHCYNGLANTITFDFADFPLPSSVIYGVSYNTSHYGAAPIGESAPCYGTLSGCGYDSLNVGSASTTPIAGTDDDEDGVFLNSSWDGAYCTGGGGTAFRLDTLNTDPDPDCSWAGYNPLVQFNATGTAAIGPCLADYEFANSTYTLMGDCTTDHTVVVPNGWTLNGAGYTITGVDPAGGHFLGAVVQGAAGPDPVTVKNLGVTVQNLSDVCDADAARLRGILFDGVGGTITNNQVVHLKQGTDSGCQEGTGIEVRNAPFTNAGADRTVAITNNTVTDYQKTGIGANGSVAATITGNTVVGAGPVNYIAQNGIQVGFGASAVVKKNSSSGNYYTPKSYVACGLLIYQADGVSASKNNLFNNERNQCNFGKGGGTFNPAP